ncbi:Uncharacterised protein [Vibrio cholerae]|uniref:Uncharacterized protein n=1 Tax=Vibrio cholerae TaxID=666 RepID=A0A655VA11_VIBCL|nr:Uncharacterised protein [Vibrio cholerae]CSB63739.1 Uncharacterised protein [Vibrio cholerae]
MPAFPLVTAHTNLADIIPFHHPTALIKMLLEMGCR